MILRISSIYRLYCLREREQLELGEVTIPSLWLFLSRAHLFLKVYCHQITNSVYKNTRSFIQTAGLDVVTHILVYLEH